MWSKAGNERRSQRRESKTYADGEGGNELASSSSDDEPKSVSERGVDIVRGLVETVASGHEEAKVELYEQRRVSRAVGECWKYSSTKRKTHSESNNGDEESPGGENRSDDSEREV